MRKSDEGNTTREIYFDQASSSFPKAPGVGKAMEEMLRRDAVNIGRGSYRSAYALLEQVMDARDHLLNLFHAPGDTALCYTAGATAALNQFIFGYLKPGDHVIASSVEHNAVMRPLCEMQKRGVSVTIAECERDGTLEPQKIEDAVRQETRAVICTHASNVCGTILPIAEIGEICRKRGLFFAVDAAQTAGILPIDMERMQIDFLAFPGHKGLRGPQGIGGFAVRKELAEQMTPLMFGGTGSRSDSEEQPDFLPDKFESGTLPLPAIIGLDAAVLQLTPERIAEIRRHECILSERFLRGITGLSGVRAVGIADPARTDERVGVISLDFPSRDNALAAFALEQEGIFTRVGLHCAPRAHKTLRTFPQGTVRFSFGISNTEEEIDTALAAIKHILKE